MKKQDIINSLQDNLNNNNVLLKKYKEFHNLLRLNIMEINDKCGTHYLGYFLKDINGLNWALKIPVNPGIPNEFYYEILSENVARDMGIETINSRIIKYSQDSELYGILSQDYRVPGYDIITGRDIVNEYLDYLKKYELLGNLGVYSEDEFNSININSLPIVYNALKFHFYKREPLHYFDGKHAESMVNTIYGNLILRYVFSYITMQKDFHLANWELRESDKGVSISPMYDMELSFNKNFYDNKNTSMKASTDRNLSYDEDFLTFYNASDTNKCLIERMLYLLNPNNIVKYLNCIPYMDDNLKKNILETYIDHFNNIEEMINNKEKKY